MQGTNHIKAEKRTSFEVVSARLPCTDVSNRTDDEQLSDKIKNFVHNLPFIDMVTVWMRGACFKLVQTYMTFALPCNAAN